LSGRPVAPSAKVAVAAVITAASLVVGACSGVPEKSTSGPSSTTPSASASDSSETTEPLSPEKLSAIGHPVIVIRSDGFLPQEREVPAGETVIWVNQDDEARVIAIEGGPESPPIPAGKWANHVFDKAGTYNYSDPTNPELTGTVTVK